ncbi:epsin-3 [Ricinus communis]|uniref:ENTH domain-containing protein n=1 Tax=Ricinus communis TaxID=3988 RepID=B9SS65_RICCO|nr:epsin-3 [Ricinus communis]XP_048235408.1 epsin-3 [Ricinus communis]EEF33568.1 conserved hypothetical protein [Ricinus communis]|eukprot:XP_002528834.1 epsin-3 [Ricinus communis]
MGILFLNQIKKQASFFLQEKYKNARLALTDISRAELLAEEATNHDPWGPDAKTMTKIAGASYEVDDYWRIVDVLHKRFDNIDWKEWRRAYKTLVLLEFLLTHGPEELAEEFQCDSEIIEELGTFKYIDEKGFDWGANMQKRSDHIITLLNGGVKLKEARLKALKITKEIQGFGNFRILSSSLSSTSSATSDLSRASSFGSYSTTSSTFNGAALSLTKEEDIEKPGLVFNEINKDKSSVITSPTSNMDLERSHVWNYSRIQETGSLLDFEEENEDEKQDSIINGICTKLVPSRKYDGEREGFRSLSDVGKLIKKKYDRQFSLGY